MRAFLLFALILFGYAPDASHAAAIQDAAAKGDVAAIITILDGGADVNQIDDNVTPLYIAAVKGNLEAAQLLIKRGANVNLATKFGTPLLVAAKYSNTEIVGLLLANGANPNAAMNSLTPLHEAAESGCLGCVTKLVEARADVNALTSEGWPAIHLAKKRDHDDIVAYLRGHGAEKFAMPPISALLAQARPKLGEEVFLQTCKQCHISMTDTGEAPPLWGVVGRKKASVEGYLSYSSALQEQTGTWTYEALNVFIAGPTRAVPGTEMDFPGLQDEKQRANVIAFLRTLSNNPLPLPAK